MSGRGAIPARAAGAARKGPEPARVPGRGGAVYARADAGPGAPDVLLVDNYDSFTFNVVQYLGELGARVTVFRNDEIDVPALRARRPDGLLLSPGPCTPDAAGVTLAAIRELAGELPMLGICLGHQAIGQAFGGRVIRNARIVHGKPSPVLHCGIGIFAGLPNPFAAGRYHSLVVERETLPRELEITAWTEEGEIMGLRHRTHAIEGVQFHPESVLTEGGKLLLGNWLAGLGAGGRASGRRVR